MSDLPDLAPVIDQKTESLLAIRTLCEHILKDLAPYKSIAVISEVCASVEAIAENMDTQIALARAAMIARCPLVRATLQ